uniref:Fidgetin-like protein 1 n=1 Tax=Phallusia mammillata TaxID=59560 RepID=A0A6F9DTK1_9ASCI|nr:spastin-like [Phallusia mammillata]
MFWFLSIILNPLLSIFPVVIIAVYFYLFSYQKQEIKVMAALSLLERVKKHHKQAFEYISEALKIDEDENGNKDVAMIWYTNGVDELQKGISIETFGASLEDKEKILRLQTKMKANLQKCQDRLVFLANPESSTKTRLKSAPARSLSETSGVGSKGGGTKPATKPVRPPWNHGAAGATTPPISSRSNHSKYQPKRSNSLKEKHNGSNNNPTASKTRKNLKSVSGDMANKIMDTAVEPGMHSIKLSDIVGQEAAKEALQDTVIRPAIRPDLYSGLRSPAKGLLLFGPPGNGKTFLAKAVASEAKSVFFNISAATLTSKWVGEGEKMVKALFAVAREVQPSIIFIDELDSLLRTRQENDNDAQRRLQTEFLLQFDGVGTDQNERILVMGATNRPHELDDAALRRFPKRIYVRLPDAETRAELLNKLLAKHDSPLSKHELAKLSSMCENYSFSDLTALAKDAALGPIRELPPELFETIDAKKMRKIRFDDFLQSVKRIRPSVSHDLMRTYERWNNEHGQTT